MNDDKTVVCQIGIEEGIGTRRGEECVVVKIIAIAEKSVDNG